MDEVQSKLDELKTQMPDEVYRQLCAATKRACDADETVMCEVTYNKLVVTIEDDKLFTTDKKHTTIMPAVEWESTMSTMMWESMGATYPSYLALRAFESNTIHMQDGHLLLKEGDEMKEERDHEFKLYRIVKLNLVVYKRARTL